MHYCFYTSGTWHGNASIVRMRELGSEFIARGHHVTYLVDDVPYNREKLNVSPRAQVVYVTKPSSIAQIAERLREIATVALGPHLLAAACGEQRQARYGGKAEEGTSRHGGSFRSVHACPSRRSDRMWKALTMSAIPWDIAPMPIQRIKSQADRFG